MNLYLLDTNAVSDLVSRPHGQVAQRYALSKYDACTSIIVAAELRFGVEKRASARLKAQLEAVLGELPVMSFEPPADTIYASLRLALEAEGTPISQNDMLIAAHALALNCILVTDNEGEFARVPGLQIENWLRP